MKTTAPLMTLCLLLLSMPAVALELAFNPYTETSPVLDAKDAYRRGNTDMVGIKMENEILLPGIKPEQQENIRKNYRFRYLNRRALKDPEQVESRQDISKEEIRQLFKLKRYANRYNMMMMKLIEQGQAEQNRQYKY